MRFNSEEMQEYGKTPDFKALHGDALQFYCEVKSIMDESKISDEHPEKVHRRIAHKIREASSQFKSVNPIGAVPNVLALVNHEPYSGLNDLLWALEDRQPMHTVDSPFISYPQVNVLLEDKGPVDLFIWVNPDSSHQLLFSSDSPFYSCLSQLFHTSEQKIHSIAPHLLFYEKGEEF